MVAVIKTKRFYLFTGKGGVGKSSLSLAFAQMLSRSQSVHYFYHPDLKEKLSLPAKSTVRPVALQTDELIDEYLARKFNKIIATFITQNSLYRTLFQIVPWLDSPAAVAKVVRLLREDPQAIVVYDSPSTGHFLSFLDLLSGVNRLFGGGALFRELETLCVMLKSEMEVQICALPQEFAYREALELQQEVARRNFEGQVLLNLSFHKAMDHYKQIDFPDFLRERAQAELPLLKRFSGPIIPYLAHQSRVELTNGLSEFLRGEVHAHWPNLA